MQIRPTSNIQSTSNVNLQTQNTASTNQPGSTIPVDALEISSEAQAITKTSADIRADRVAEIKAQIVSGQYESAEKLDAAVSRMFEAIG